MVSGPFSLRAGALSSLSVSMTMKSSLNAANLYVEIPLLLTTNELPSNIREAFAPT